jgi:hypothetical protein
VRDAFGPLDTLRPVANRLERHVGIVRDVARILETGRLRTPAAGADGGGGHDTQPQAATGAPPAAPAPGPARPPAAQVKRVLRRYLHQLEALAPRRGRGAPTGHFVDHLVKLSTSYWPGLFHTYDHPDLPRTNNALEGVFGSSKHAQRCTTGRASTAGGKLQSCGEFALGAQALMATLTKPDLDQHLTGVSDADFATSKQHLRCLGEPARERRSIQRRLAAFLERTVAAWLGHAPASRGP